MLIVLNVDVQCSLIPERIVHPRKDPSRQYTFSNRTPNKATARRVKKTSTLTDIGKMSSLASQPCCRHDCLQHFSVYHISSVRQQYTLSGDEATITRNVATLLQRSPPPQYMLLGQRVCSAAFVAILGISRHKLRSAVEFNASGGFQRQIRRASASKTEYCYAFLYTYFNAVCQIMAEASDKQGHPVMRLPKYVRSCELLELLQSEWTAEYASTPPSYSTMMKCWRVDFSHVQVPRNTEYGTCGDCFDLAARLRSVKTPDQKITWERDLTAHHQLHTEERKAMTARLRQLKLDPTLAAWFGVDGTMPTALPSLRPRISVSIALTVLLRLLLPTYPHYLHRTTAIMQSLNRKQTMCVHWGGILSGDDAKHLYFFLDEWKKTKGANFVGAYDECFIVPTCTTL